MEVLFLKSRLFSAKLHYFPTQLPGSASLLMVFRRSDVEALRP
jgi:hypothetical protein